MKIYLYNQSQQKRKENLRNAQFYLNKFVTMCGRFKFLSSDEIEELENNVLIIIIIIIIIIMS
jgi:hypothetical protein